MPLFKKRHSNAAVEQPATDIIQPETPQESEEIQFFDDLEADDMNPGEPEIVQPAPIEPPAPEAPTQPAQDDYDPEKESIFYFGLPKDPPKKPEPIKVTGVPTYELVSHRRYKKRNRHPLSMTAKAILTLIGVIAAFALLLLIIWLVFPS